MFNILIFVNSVIKLLLYLVHKVRVKVRVTYSGPQL